MNMLDVMASQALALKQQLESAQEQLSTMLVMIEVLQDRNAPKPTTEEPARDPDAPPTVENYPAFGKKGQPQEIHT